MFITRYNPNILNYSFDDIFGDFFNDKKEYFSLQQDDETKEFYFEVELPGVKKSDTKISVDEKKLYISAERKGKRAFNYEKTILLPKNLDPESCRVTLEDGIMKILFKERGEIKTNRKEITVG